jgi:hypothetical protein
MYGLPGADVHHPLAHPLLWRPGRVDAAQQDQRGLLSRHPPDYAGRISIQVRFILCFALCRNAGRAPLAVRRIRRILLTCTCWTIGSFTGPAHDSTRAY